MTKTAWIIFGEDVYYDAGSERIIGVWLDGQKAYAVLNGLAAIRTPARTAAEGARAKYVAKVNAIHPGAADGFDVSLLSFGMEEVDITE